MFTIVNRWFSRRGKGVKNEYQECAVIGIPDTTEDVDYNGTKITVVKTLDYSKVPNVTEGNVNELLTFAAQTKVNLAECFAIGFDVLSRRADTPETVTERILGKLGARGLSFTDSDVATACVSSIRKLVASGLFDEDSAIDTFIAAKAKK